MTSIIFSQLILDEKAEELVFAMHLNAFFRLAKLSGLLGSILRDRFANFVLYTLLPPGADAWCVKRGRAYKVC